MQFAEKKKRVSERQKFDIHYNIQYQELQDDQESDEAPSIPHKRFKALWRLPSRITNTFY